MHFMVMRHCAPVDRLAGRAQRCLHILPDEGELALCLQRQRLSIKLISLPFFRLAGHGDHVVVRFFPVGLGLLPVATQRVDARAQRDGKSGRSDALACVAPFEPAPFLLQLDYLIPPI